MVKVRARTSIMNICIRQIFIYNPKTGGGGRLFKRVSDQGDFEFISQFKSLINNQSYPFAQIPSIKFFNLTQVLVNAVKESILFLLCGK